MLNKTNIVLKGSMIVRGGFEFQVELPGPDGTPVERTLRLAPRPGWEDAQAEALAKLETTNIPRYTIRVNKFPYSRTSFNGTGALWLRGDDFHTGSFTWLDKDYSLVRAIVDLEELTTDEETGEVKTTTKKRDVFSIEAMKVEKVDATSDIYS